METVRCEPLSFILAFVFILAGTRRLRVPQIPACRVQECSALLMAHRHATTPHRLVADAYGRRESESNTQIPGLAIHF
jgi:hypothetical protein